jgi:hypothetical protein
MIQWKIIHFSLKHNRIEDPLELVCIIDSSEVVKFLLIFRWHFPKVQFLTNLFPIHRNHNNIHRLQLRQLWKFLRFCNKVCIQGPLLAWNHRFATYSSSILLYYFIILAEARKCLRVVMVDNEDQHPLNLAIIPSLWL